MKKSRRIWFLLVVLCLASLVVSSCALSHHSAVWISNPHTGDTFGSNPEFTLRVEANVSGNSVVWQTYDYEVWDNGQLISSRHDVPIDQRELSLVMRPTDNGLHVIEVKGRAAYPDRDYIDLPNNPYRTYSDWYRSNNVCYWVGPNVPEDFCITTRAETGYGPSPHPTPSPFPTFAPTAVPLIQSVSAFPAPIYYGDVCPSLSSVTFRAVLGLPSGMTPDQVTVQAHVNVAIGSAQSNSGHFLVPLNATGTWDTATGGAIFSGTLALTHAYNDANNQFDPAALAGGSGALLWYADASSHAGQVAVYLGRSANQVINLAPCPVGPPPRLQQNPGENGSNPQPQSGCEQYTNQLSCNLAGCSWTGSSCVINP